MCKGARNKHEEVWIFGDFGNNPYKIKDNNEYCEKHFQEMDLKYDKKITKTQKSQ
jgi:hypothetical protein